MLPMTAAATAAIEGSRAGEYVTVNAFFGDSVVAQGLVPVSWSLTGDMTRQVHTQGEIVVSDPTGALSPWVTGDPLAPASQVQVTWVCADGSMVPRARMVITKAVPTDRWRLYGAGHEPVWLPGGSTITLSVEDVSRVVQRDRFMAPWSPSESTVVGEVKRLLSGIVPVVDESASTVTVPASTVYERERLDAVDDLLDHAGLIRRIDGSGVMHIIDPAVLTPVWTISGGNGGALVDLGRSLELGDIWNSVVASSSAGSEEIVGRAYLNDGPERWGGPAGNAPYFLSSPLIASQSAADAAARTRLTNLTEAQSVSLTVTALPHPGIELGDVVTIPAPTRAGGTSSITGTVTACSWGGDSNGLSASRITVTAPRRQVMRAIRGTS